MDALAKMVQQQVEEVHTSLNAVKQEEDGESECSDWVTDQTIYDLDMMEMQRHKVMFLRDIAHNTNNLKAELKSLKSLMVSANDRLAQINSDTDRISGDVDRMPESMTQAASRAMNGF